MFIYNLVAVIYYNFENHCCMVADEGVHEILPSLRGSFNVESKSDIYCRNDWHSQKIVGGQWVCVLRFELSLKGKKWHELVRGPILQLGLVCNCILSSLLRAAMQGFRFLFSGDSLTSRNLMTYKEIVFWTGTVSRRPSQKCTSKALCVAVTESFFLINVSKTKAPCSLVQFIMTIKNGVLHQGDNSQHRALFLT